MPITAPRAVRRVVMHEIAERLAAGTARPMGSNAGLRCVGSGTGHFVPIGTRVKKRQHWLHHAGD